jgi:hypothetical protein
MFKSLIRNDRHAENVSLGINAAFTKRRCFDLRRGHGFDGRRAIEVAHLARQRYERCDVRIPKRGYTRKSVILDIQFGN